MSALGDIDGFRHDDLAVSPARGEHGPHYGTNRSIAFAENVPSYMVRTHDAANTTHASYSTDGGSSWTAYSNEPAGVTGAGHVAVSANGDIIVWSPGGAGVSYSINNGNSWSASSGIPAGLKPIADRVNNSTFYAFDAVNGRVYRSTNGGANFTVANSTLLPALPSYSTGDGDLRTPFGHAGHVWVTTGGGGLYFSANGGTSFSKMSGVNAAYKVAFGKAAPNQTYPAVFIFGTVNNLTGLFRSDDRGVSWVKINNSEQEYGRFYPSMTGDPRVYGRLYIGTQGRGIVYGDIKGVTDPEPPVNNSPVAALSATPTTGTAPLEVSFNANGSTDVDGDPLTYNWDFGDGNSAFGAVVNHTYTKEGNFVATLTVTDNKGASRELIWLLPLGLAG